MKNNYSSSFCLLLRLVFMDEIKRAISSPQSSCMLLTSFFILHFSFFIKLYTGLPDAVSDHTA